MRVRFRRESVFTPQVSAHSFPPIPHGEEAKRLIVVFVQIDSVGCAGFFRHNLQVCWEVPRRLPAASRLSPVSPI